MSYRHQLAVIWSRQEAKMSKLMVAIIVLAVIPACSVQRHWQATGGSKADGVVRLSYEVPTALKAVVDDQAGLQLAIKRCSSWGFKAAEPFGGETHNCIASGGLGGCSAHAVTREYQCLDAEQK
ncbi:MAG: hypothetical protein CTY18_03050 [Methylomonas sp.]|nr:MAG: hypothetical protein CTY18_03050 [Methylomonas sp.]